MSLLRGFLLLLVPCLIPLSSEATLLASFGQPVGGTFQNGSSTTIFIRVCFSAQAPEPPTVCPWEPSHANLFADLTFGSDEAGLTFIATSATDPAFPAVQQFLTNGVNDQIEFDWGAPETGLAGSGKRESDWLFGDPTGASGIDLAGFTIDSISLTLSSDFSVVGNPVLNTTTATGSALIQIFGEVVPEPSTALLVGLGLAGLCLRRTASIG